jgi:hypothetical protein
VSARKTQPLLIYRSVNGSGQTFALEPRSRDRVRRAFGDAHVHPRVFIAHEAKADHDHVRAELLRRVAELLTGVTLERLEQEFGSVMLRDPVTERELRAS